MSDQIKNYCIAPGLFKLDGGAMFGIIPKPLWNKVAPADELNRIELDLRLWLIIDRASNKVILTDTGIGDYHGQSFDDRFCVRQENNPLKQTLAKLDLVLDDITDLIVSHLHFDHIGGLTNSNKECIFKNAIIHLHKKHYEYSLSPTQRDAGSFHGHTFNEAILKLDQEKRVNWLSGEKGKILSLSNGENINFICSHGHTPYLVHPYSDEFIYLADLIPTSNHISIAWVMGYDISPGITTLNKADFLEFIYNNKLKIIFEHDPKYWGCDIEKDEKKGFVAKNIFEKIKSTQGFDHITEI